MNKNVLEQLIKKNKSISQIADELNYSRTNVVYWLKKYGLSTSLNRYNKIDVHKCHVCGENDQTKFYGKKKSKCKRCQAQYNTEHGRRNKRKAIEYKGGKCNKCGYNKCINALDFHHRDPTIKDKNWDRIRARNWDKIVKEIDKCDLLCSNCHRELHDKIFVPKYYLKNIGKIKKEPKPLIIKKCKQCKEEFTTKKDKRKFCSVECSKIFARKVKRPSKNELKSIIESKKSFVQIGKDFGVSDSSVRKWAKQYEII